MSLREAEEVVEVHSELSALSEKLKELVLLAEDYPPTPVHLMAEAKHFVRVKFPAQIVAVVACWLSQGTAEPFENNYLPRIALVSHLVA